MISLKKILIGSFVLALSVFIVYSNTLKADWQFDDLPNIVHNKFLHITDLSPASLFQTLFAHPSKPGALYRPIPCLTFALNWYWRANEPGGFHLVNVVIHCLNGLLLFLLISNIIFRYKAASLKIKSNAHSIALIASLIWVLHPLHTQAVTYIVQRMALLATFFTLLAMIFYLKARFASKSFFKIGYLLLTLLSFMAALGSKENAVMLPISILLLEVSFFKENSVQGRFLTGKGFLVLVVLGLTIIVALVPFYEQITIGNIINGYQGRPFSLQERILTQPRVVIFYLTLLAWPHPSRLSIEHAIPVSNSFFSPWTTIFAIVALIVLGGIAIWWLRKKPLICFPILFFLLNHVVESTIIPLEMVFEHRNYLPSLFLFLPLGVFGQRIAIEPAHRKWPKKAIFVGLVLVLVVLGVWTQRRNEIWKTPYGLWEDARRKAPAHARPYHKLGVIVGWQKEAGPKEWQEALVYFQEALLRQTHKKIVRADLYGNLAILHENLGNFAQANDFIDQAAQLRPDHRKYRFDAARINIRIGDWEQAYSHSLQNIQTGGRKTEYLLQYAHILLCQNQSKRALPILKQALQAAPDSDLILTYVALCFLRQGEFESARSIFVMLQERGDSLYPLLGLIEISLLQNDERNARYWSTQLIERFPIETTMAYLSNLHPNNLKPPFDRKGVHRFINRNAEFILIPKKI